MITPLKILLFFIALGFAIPLNAQGVENTLEEEIIEQIWKPFKYSYEARDREIFKNIHADNVLRITDFEIKTAKEYRTDISNWKTLPEGTTMTIDFALESSNLKENIAYQVGYYRVKVISDKTTSATYYGQFHVVLKRIDSTWKITQDFDTSKVNGEVVDEDFFERARLLFLHK
jgi:hypothetical protein